jgi:alpha-galactosidase
VYVNIDDTWEGQRDAQGNIHPNAKFPDMKALGDYIHSKGLKFGIYSSPGPKTCSGYEGSYGHEAQDAATYASWGVDYLKYDLCRFDTVMKQEAAAHPQDPQAANKLMIAAYAKMGKALRATGRPMVYSLCQYGNDAVWEWGPSVGANLWRTTSDMLDTYARVEIVGFSQAGLSRFAGPGHWNDPDLLEVGNGKMNNNEYKTQVSLWAIVAAPFIATNDLAHMTAQTKALLMNKEVIAIDQDRAGEEGNRLSEEGPIEIWVRPLANGDEAVGIFNRHPGMMKASLDPDKLGVGPATRVRNVWDGINLPLSRATMNFDIPGHGVILLRVSH